MLGNPKYKKGDMVTFAFEHCGTQIKVTGNIEIVDAYGTFGQPYEVSYDVFCAEDSTLYKHILESLIKE